MMSVNDLKHHVELWEILDEIKLTYLAIELCAQLPHRAGQQGVEQFVPEMFFFESIRNFQVHGV